jgi:ureidoglycolate hydrolase
MSATGATTVALPVYEIVAEPLTEEAFRPFGQASIPEPFAEDWEDDRHVGGIDLFRDDSQGELHIEVLKVEMLPELMRRTNRHWGFTQFFAFMRGKFAIIVADPDMSAEEYDPARTKVFIADEGTSVAIRRETWHIEPCGLEPASILAISQTDTMIQRTEAIEDLGEKAVIRYVIPESLL